MIIVRIQVIHVFSLGTFCGTRLWASASINREFLTTRTNGRTGDPYLPILALQERTSWDVDNLSLFGIVKCCKTGSTTLLVSSQICNVQKSWSAGERCTAVFFGAVMVICVYAPDYAKDFEQHEKFMRGLTKMMQDGRKDVQHAALWR